MDEWNGSEEYNLGNKNLKCLVYAHFKSDRKCTQKHDLAILKQSTFERFAFLHFLML